jgi:hypothetical protein
LSLEPAASMGQSSGGTAGEGEFFFKFLTLFKTIFKFDTVYFFFKSNTFGRAYCRGMAKPRRCVMHGGAAKEVTWRRPGR